ACAVSSLWCTFFFQAEDGIRDFHVTGVQTCALPIYEEQVDEAGDGGVDEEDGQHRRVHGHAAAVEVDALGGVKGAVPLRCQVVRSEERRVGKEWRARWSPEQEQGA